MAVNSMSNEPRVAIEASTTAASPAAGPLTLVWDWLIKPTTMPPTMPAIIPDISGASEAKAMPRHSGKATRNTTTLAGKSYFRFCRFIISSQY